MTSRYCQKYCVAKFVLQTYWTDRIVFFLLTVHRECIPYFVHTGNSNQHILYIKRSRNTHVVHVSNIDVLSSRSNSVPDMDIMSPSRRLDSIGEMIGFENRMRSRSEIRARRTPDETEIHPQAESCRPECCYGLSHVGRVPSEIDWKAMGKNCPTRPSCYGIVRSDVRRCTRDTAWRAWPSIEHGPFPVHGAVGAMFIVTQCGRCVFLARTLYPGPALRAGDLGLRPAMLVEMMASRWYNVKTEKTTKT